MARTARSGRPRAQPLRPRLDDPTTWRTSAPSPAMTSNSWLDRWRHPPDLDPRRVEDADAGTHVAGRIEGQRGHVPTLAAERLELR